MTDPLMMDTTSPRLSLPLLFVGQVQKEIFVNEALLRLDGLVHCAIEEQRNAPPTNAIDGLCWLVGPVPTGAWAEQGGAIAIHQLGQWHFCAARDGLRVLNKSTGQFMARIAGTWQAPAAPAAPEGGTVIDTEARAAIVALSTALKQCGILRN